MAPEAQPRKQVPTELEKSGRGGPLNEKTLNRRDPLLQYPFAPAPFGPVPIFVGSKFLKPTPTTPGISNARVCKSVAVLGTFPVKSPPADEKLAVLVFFWR